MRSSVIAESATTAADGKIYQVEFYNLDLAERQARSRRVMTMGEWIAKLDDFMRISDREILTHAGHVTHEAALEKAEGEFEKFRWLEDEKPSPVEQHFHEAIHRHAVVNSLTFFAPNDHPMANRVEWLVCWIRRLVFCFSRRLLGGLVG